MAEGHKDETAAELMARLRADPEWVRRHEENEAKHQAIVALLQMEMYPEEAPLLAEIAAAGTAGVSPACRRH